MANRKSISHKCHPVLVAFVWELIKQTIVLPLGCLQGGRSGKSITWRRPTLGSYSRAHPPEIRIEDPPRPPAGWRHAGSRPPPRLPSEAGLRKTTTGRQRQTPLILKTHRADEGLGVERERKRRT